MVNINYQPLKNEKNMEDMLDPAPLLILFGIN
jgi:hypothetical protein